MKLKIFSLLIILLASSCTHQNEQDKLAEEAQTFLFNVLESNYKWEKVHAAEGLIDLGYSDAVRNQFIKEHESYANTSQYRVGILRVLARSSRSESEKAAWIDEIATIYKDTTNADRLHASETLAKLNINLKKIDYERTISDLISKDTLLRAFVTWACCVYNHPDSINFEGLISMVKSTNETMRKTGAYALGFCDSLASPYLDIIVQKALDEPADSNVWFYLLKAASFHTNDDALRVMFLERMKEAIPHQSFSHLEDALYVTCMTMAEKGTCEDLPFLEEIFSGNFPVADSLLTTEGINDIKAASAYSILKIHQRKDKKMAFPDWFILGAYGLLMLGIGYYYSKRNKNAEDYHLGGRTMNPVMVGLSLFATLMSTLTYLSYPGEMIKYGPVIFASLASFPLVYLIVGWLIIPRFMKMKVTSAYEILEIKIGPRVRIMAIFFFLSLRLLWMATIIYATVDTAMVSIFGIQDGYIPLACIILTLITIVYTSMGGFKAVVITDVLQTGIMILAALLTIFLVAAQIGSFSDIFPEKIPSHWDSITWGFDATQRMSVANAILSIFVWYICTAGSDQMAIQRYFATKDVQSARKTFGISLITNFLVQVLLALVGLAVLAYFTQRPYELPAGETIFSSADSLFPRYIVIGLPVGITGLVVAGLLSSAMSSLSSGLNSTSTVISEDIIKRFSTKKKDVNYLNQARIISVIIGVIVTLLCLLVGYVQGNLLEIVIKVVNLFVAPLFVLFFMALFIPFSTQTGTIIGGILSVVVAVSIAFFEAFGLKVLWIMPMAFTAGILFAMVFSAGETYLKSNLNKYNK